jgi:peptidoglycan LD-endopeptidase LytH
MLRRWLGAALIPAIVAALPANPCVEFDALYARIRDQRIDRAAALARVRELVPQIREYYVAHGGHPSSTASWRFPLEGYGAESIGGKNGSGYQPNGYDWFDGYKSRGHPGHDLFIHDRDQDTLDDRTGQPVNVLSITDGVVVAYSPEWQPASGLRGGKYLYIYSLAANGLFYYAHNQSVAVKPGDIVAAGQVIAAVGRSGKNASERRSPTHLHVMFLSVGDDGSPRPRDIYRDLIRFARGGAGR